MYLLNVIISLFKGDIVDDYDPLPYEIGDENFSQDEYQTNNGNANGELTNISIISNNVETIPVENDA